MSSSGQSSDELLFAEMHTFIRNPGGAFPTMLSGEKDQYWGTKAKEVSAKRKKTAAVFDRRTLREMKAGYDRWLNEVYSPWVAKAPETKERFETASGIPLKPLYTP
ncbi:MAG: hypothetical protein ACRD6W_19280, partial [Nitrososphaerales archaeon]